MVRLNSVYAFSSEMKLAIAGCESSLASCSAALCVAVQVRRSALALPSFKTLESHIYDLGATWDRQSFWCPASGSNALWRHFFSVLSPQATANVPLVGVEWWIRIRPASETQHFHFDKDEILLRETGKLFCPVVSMVLYFNEIGGPTLISTRTAGDIGRLSLKAPRELAAVNPEANKLLWFPGDLGHAVLGSNQFGSRTTLIMNWWQSKPRRMRSTPNGLRLPSVSIGKFQKSAPKVFTGKLFVPRMLV